MTEIKLIPFNDWVPDQADLNDAGLIISNNCIPVKDGYEPFKDAVVWSTNALNGNCLGAISVVNSSGNVVTFAGTSDKLWKLTGQTFSDVSKNVSGYQTDESVWRFLSWATSSGNNFVFATNYSNPIQLFDLGSGIKFEDLSPTAPICRDIAIVNSFLVAVNTTEGGTNFQSRVRWSPIGNPEGTWGTDVSTQADFQDLFSGDFAIGIAGGEYGIIFCNNAIYKMTYIGPDPIFQFDEIEKSSGLLGINAFKKIDEKIFYVSNDGFFVFNGSASVSIGNERVDRYFETNVNLAFKDKTLCSVNREKNIVMWHYVSSVAIDSNFDRALIYNYVLNKWCSADIVGVFIVGLDKQGYTLDELDPFGNMDVITPSLDSSFWKGGADIFGVFGTDNKLYYFTGNNKDAQFITSDYNLNNFGTAFFERVRPLRDGGVASVSVCGRKTQADPIVFGTVRTQTTLGDMNIRDNNRFQRIKVDLIGNGWNEIQGIIINYHNAGFR